MSSLLLKLLQFSKKRIVYINSSPSDSYGSDRDLWSTFPEKTETEDDTRKKVGNNRRVDSELTSVQLR